MKQCICIIATILAFAPVIVLGYQNPGSPSGFLNDFGAMLTSDQRATIESKLVQFQQQTSNEVAVVTIPSLGGDTIENFAVKLFQDWGIGSKSHDNGVLLLIARDDKKIRIEVGYGLEGALTDAQSASIINDVITPAFQQGDYVKGISDGIDAIIAATQGEYSAPAKKSNTFESLFSQPFFVFGIIYGILALMRGLASTKSWWLGGVIGGIIGLIVQSLILGAVFVGIGLVIDFLLSRFYSGYKSSGRSIPWWFNGFGGSGRSGGGGFGGFGGGRSGGGGASGGW